MRHTYDYAFPEVVKIMNAALIGIIIHLHMNVFIVGLSFGIVLGFIILVAHEIFSIFKKSAE